MDTHVVARLSKLDEVLNQTRADYQNRERLRADVASLLRTCHTLQPRSGSFSNGGRSVELFYLYGVLPIAYKGAEYNVPVTVYFDQAYPKQPPRCFVTPTPGMALKAGHPHVDEGGMVHVPYLTSWKEKTSTLTELVALVTSAFSAAPPVYATAVQPKPTMSSPPPQVEGGGATGSTEASGRSRIGQGGAQPSTYARAHSGSRPRTGEQLSNFSRSRKDALVQSASEAVRERWPSTFARLVKGLKEQLDTQEQLQAEDLDDLGGTNDSDNQQALNCLAEELALGELLIGLDELLAAQKITLEDFLREVRDVSRRQFLCRAQRLKSAAVSAAAAPAPEVADSIRQLPMGGQQALKASGTSSSGLADRWLTGGRRL
jgi:ESCRT-I complex subunit TSG101|mmetsp:Transcript_82442/g.163599  ORF Transcript_82442/g.163599 Transcript_82442/m.163599 type:complete len:374 (-) Transcript_82442:151-1272(-)